MQTLVFNTKTKTVVVYEGVPEESKIIHTFNDVPTVSVAVAHYEVKAKVMINEIENRVPVARFPIYNTNMLIQN
jgi:hypothetical protein